MSENITINSWEELQANINQIIAFLNRNENLKIAAAVNPFFALEELGYEINPDIKESVEDKIRFKTKGVARLKKLRESIFKIFGRPFDIRSEEELNRVIFEDLGLAVFDEKACRLSQFIRGRKKRNEPDDLEPYRELHAIVPPLLQFRELDASVAGFCDRETYRQIRSGEVPINSNLKLEIRLKKNEER